MSERLEGERQEQVIRLYLSQAHELDQWLEGMHAAVTSMAEQTTPADVDEEDQLATYEVRAPSGVPCASLHETAQGDVKSIDDDDDAADDFL